ncbi:MAG: DUF433 domain-containing protein [Acidobacteriaceae bacterium]
MSAGQVSSQQPGRRLLLPAYHVVDAARYAGVAVGTIRNWQKARKHFVPALAQRELGFSLSFLQLVELRFVAAMRQAGLPIRKIRAAREYLAKAFKVEFPFADLRLKSDGQDIILDLEEEQGAEFRGKVLIANKGGQYSWKDVIGSKFAEFDYEDHLARRWHVAGPDSPIVIDPFIAFGAPQIRGIPTWVLKNRHDGGESSKEIARDFRLPKKLVQVALAFENKTTRGKRQSKAWVH